LRSKSAGISTYWPAGRGTCPPPPKYAGCFQPFLAVAQPAGADNLALYTQHIGGLGSVEDKIIDCFVNGGGVPYAGFHRFHEVMAEGGFSHVTVEQPEAFLTEIKRFLAGVSGQFLEREFWYRGYIQ
jgi:hypothetical protein